MKPYFLNIGKNSVVVVETVVIKDIPAKIMVARVSTFVKKYRNNLYVVIFKKQHCLNG